MTDISTNNGVFSRLKSALGSIGIATWIIAVFWFIILVIGHSVGISVETLLTDTIKRAGMNSVLVLAMVPAIQSGTGPNFALPIGIVCGLFALLCSIEFAFLGASWFLVSVLLSVVFAAIAGYVYGKLLNAVKGSEMTIATFTGFSIVALMCLVWLKAPLNHPQVGWFIGDGARETIQLDAIGGDKILNNFMAFSIGGELVVPVVDVEGTAMIPTEIHRIDKAYAKETEVPVISKVETSVDMKTVTIPGVKSGGIIPSFKIGDIMTPAVIAGKGITMVISGDMKLPVVTGDGITAVSIEDNTIPKVVREVSKPTVVGGILIPTGLLLFFALLAFLVWLFFRSKAGIAISAGGINPKFAQAAGLNIDRSRILANILSTVLGAVGIIVYSQSYGYAQLYQGPLMMAFPAVAAILIGGATASRAKISHVVIGVVIFQGLLTAALPVTNELFRGTDLSEIARMIIQNGVILYALTQVRKVS
jgi:ribose/xylose/arabinose/galactoside ABC-type transport system permease subunit